MTQGGMYNWRVKSVLDALARQGKAEGPLTVEDLVGLGHLDQYHYLGVTACDHVIELLGLESGRTVLDIGSGIGGPARYLAATTGCSVLGIEIQSALCEAATELTSRAGLGERVKYITADAAAMQEVVLPAPFQPHGEGFDHFISQLVNLHVPDRSALLGSVYTRLRPGATFVIEDFCESAPLLNSERQLLVDVVKAQSITTTASYVAELESMRNATSPSEAVSIHSPISWNMNCVAIAVTSQSSTASTRAEKMPLPGDRPRGRGRVPSCMAAALRRGIHLCSMWRSDAIVTGFRSRSLRPCCSSWACVRSPVHAIMTVSFSVISPPFSASKDW